MSVNIRQSSVPKQLTAEEAIHRSRGTLELASRALEGGRGEQAATILEMGARELELTAMRVGSSGRTVLNLLADTMWARAESYRQIAPRPLREKAGELIAISRKVLSSGKGLKSSHSRWARLLEELAIESLVQAEVLLHAAENSEVMIGRGVSQAYRAIVNASFDKRINDSGALNNFLTGKRDSLQAEKGKMKEVFDYIDKKMEREGFSFDRAWSAMFNDHHLADVTVLPSFPTAHEAAVFPRDHETTRGFLTPISDLSRALTDGNLKGADMASGALIKALRENGQWEIARSVLDDLSKNARTQQGVVLATTLNDNERREWWSQRAGRFAREDLPVLLIGCLLSGGVGLGARALALTANLGTRAVRGVQIAAEIISFVPTERVLNDIMNNRRADWSAGSLARDYALTAASFGLFYTLGICWRAWRAPTQVTADAAKTVATPVGKPTRVGLKEAQENVQALTRENESAVTLRRHNYPVEQNPEIPGGNVPGVKKPDYRIGPELFDNYAPTTHSARNIWKNVAGKVEAEQARRIVLNLDDSAVDLVALQKQFKDWRIEGLEQVLVIKKGNVLPLPLPKKPATGMTLKGYPDQRE